MLKGYQFKYELEKFINKKRYRNFNIKKSKCIAIRKNN